MRPDVERLEQLRRGVGRVRVVAWSGRLSYSVGDYVWAKFGQTRGLQLGRVMSPHPVAFENIDSLKDWWELQLFSLTHHQWVEKTTFRRILQALTPTEIRTLRDAGVIAEAAL